MMDVALAAEKMFGVKIVARFNGGAMTYEDLISADDHIQAVRKASEKFVRNNTFDSIESFKVEEVPFAV